MEDLKQVLLAIKENDTNYIARYKLVFKALHLALENGLNAGVRIDQNEPDWPVVYIELPTGQVSWHMPAYEIPWDGHSTEEKYKRIGDFACLKQYCVI